MAACSILYALSCDGGSFISSAVLEADLLELYFNLDLDRGNRVFGRVLN